MDCAYPAHHHYPTFIIGLSISMYTEALCSFRAIAAVFLLLADYINIPTPSFSTIRRWLYRFGYYQLNRAVAFGEDWIFIIDQTVELGVGQCQVILGISKAHLQESGYILTHKDVTLLDIELRKSSKGEDVHERIEQVSQCVGLPVQIVSDYGNNIRSCKDIRRTSSIKIIK